MGMIKEIENQINRKFGDQQSSRPQTIPRKKLEKREFSNVPMSKEELNVVGSSRRLELAIDTYNKDHQIIIHHLTDTHSMGGGGRDSS